MVDDVPANRKLLARGLQRLGYSTVLAADGREAVAACDERARAYAADASGSAGPDGVGEGSRCLGLVTMDKSMPVMDGIEATRAIRASHGSLFVIVGLTGDALGDDLESFRGAGLDGVLGKPASAKEVHRAARRIFQLSFEYGN